MLEALSMISNTRCKTKQREQGGKRERGEKEKLLLGEIILHHFPRYGTCHHHSSLCSQVPLLGDLFVSAHLSQAGFGAP